MHSNGSHGTQRCYFLTFNTTRIDQVRNVYIVAATLDTILILPTIALNVLLIISLYRSSEIRKPSTKLLFSLALSDVFIGMLVEPTLLAKKIAEIEHDFRVYCSTGVITYALGGALTAVSFYTMTGIAIDRYLIIHKGSKYRNLMTNKRVKIIVIILWVSAFVLMTAQLYSPRSPYFKVAASITVVCVVMASVCYIKCFLTLRNHQRLIGNLKEGVSRQNIQNTCNYSKSMHTMCYVFLAFNLCWLPFLFTAISAAVTGESAVIWAAESIASVFIYGNSLLNPIILFSRMKEIRRAFVMTLSINSNDWRKRHDQVQNLKCKNSMNDICGETPVSKNLCNELVELQFQRRPIKTEASHCNKKL